MWRWALAPFLSVQRIPLQGGNICSEVRMSGGNRKFEGRWLRTFVAEGTVLRVPQVGRKGKNAGVNYMGSETEW